jgi:DNA polymerase I-like protein with 3'-5' exonuclease and polymerase domains
MMTQVHDELVFKGLEPSEVSLIETAMCDVKPFQLRVEYGSGKTWWEAFENKENK